MSIEFPGDDKLCDHCDRPGISYEYKGQTYSGLTSHRGEKLCPSCRDAVLDAEGINILVKDDRPGMEPYIYNTVRDRDLAILTIPAHLRGIDGRDAYRTTRRRRSKGH